MHKRVMIIGLTLCIAVFGGIAAAQTNTFPASGNVGIGTTSPAYPLAVNGEVSAGGFCISGANCISGTVDGIPLGLGGGGNSSNIAIGINSLLSNTAGLYDVGVGYKPLYDNTSGIMNVGVGYEALYSNTGNSFNVGIGGYSLYENIGSQNIGVGYEALYSNTNGAYNVAIGTQSGFDGVGIYNDNTFVGAGIGFGANSAVSNNTIIGTDAGYSLQGNGNVMVGDYAGSNYAGSNAFFIGNVSQSSAVNDQAYSLLYGTFAGTPGTTAGQSLTVNGTLGVNGGLKLTASGGSIIFPDNTVQSTAYTGVTCGGDFAESVDVSGSRNKYQAGDVLVLAAQGDGDVARSSGAYSTLVAGIYSTKPGYVGRRLTTPKSPDEIPMAMVGIVPTKVSAENGPIHRGDLLVTASLNGYAMKGTDRKRMLGAVLGKAMGSLDFGTGVIEVLVTLQ
jgi:hypothetical protein